MSLTKRSCYNRSTLFAVFTLGIVLALGGLVLQRFKVHVYVNAYSSDLAFGRAVELTSDDMLPSGRSSHANEVGYQFQAGHVSIFLERKQSAGRMS